MQDSGATRKIRISAEAVVEVTDEEAVKQSALADIASTELHAGDGRNIDSIRAAESDRVRNEVAAAIQWLADPYSVLPDDLDGAEITETSHSVIELDDNGLPISAEPDFARLFALCRCGRQSCAECGGFQLTPKTAATLWSMGVLLAHQAYDDVLEHGDDPVTNDATWALLDEYPCITHQQNAVWRRQAARSFDDLVDDLARGEWPQPRCPAEEMALHKMLERAQAAVKEGWTGIDDAALPDHPDDFDWDLLYGTLFQDLDILDLFEPHLDGVEDPDYERNRDVGMGDYRAQAWFTWFLNMQPRDGRRPFRR